jgi:hypothetical protein
MNEENKNMVRSFKYNLSFYYQSTIIYFIAFVLYVIIRGEFIEDSFTLITKDPIIYFFGIIVLISIFSLLWNAYKNKHLEVTESSIVFKTRMKIREIPLENIETIKISRDRGTLQTKAFRLIRIKIKNRRRLVIIRPYDYENEGLLLKKFQELELKINR